LYSDKNTDLSEFSNQQSLDIINKISKLTDNQLLWWFTFVGYHRLHLPLNSQSALDLVDLYNGFEYFLIQYKLLAKQNNCSGSLPSTCQFENACNLKTSLFRLLEILKQSPNFAEQIKNLDHLSLGAEDSVKAVMDGMRFITKDMS